MNFEHWGYAGIIVVLLLCGLGLPVPEDLPLLTGGWLCYEGRANVWIMILAGLVGVLSGDFFLFWLGRRFGHRILQHRIGRKLANPERLIKAERLFERHGFKIIFVGRFLPGLRPMLWMACGISRVPTWIFTTTNGIAACISVPTLVFLGKWCGHSIHKVQKDVRNVMHLIFLIAITLALGGFGYYFHKKQKRLLAEAAAKDSVIQEASSTFTLPLQS